MAGLLVISDKTVAVEPGGEAACLCRIKNTGSIVDQFSLQVLGPAAAFSAPDPQSVSLFPGADGEITLRIKPPATQRAGQLPLGVKLVSAVEPQVTVVEEATLQVGAFVAVTARLVPRVRKGRSVGKHTLVLRNTGNAPTKVRINGSDPDDLIRFRGLGAVIPLAPGTPQRIKLRYRSTAAHMTGPPESHQFTLSVVPEKGDPVPADGIFLQRAAISGWMIMACAGIIALIALVLILKQLQNGNIQTQAKSAAPLGQGTPTPSASAAATTATTSTAASSAATSSAKGNNPPPPPPTTRPINVGVPGQPASVATGVGVLFAHTMPSASDSTGLFSADIYTMSSGGPVDLTNNAGQDFLSPSYAPDGQHVAFSAFAGGNHNERSIWIADARIQNATQRLIDCSNCTLVAWSYDGSLIAYVSGNSLLVLPATGTLQQGQVIANAPSTISSIAWTRDSSHIAYTTGGQVVLVSRSGGSPKALASGNVASGVTFSPDGHFIAYGMAPSGSATQIVVGALDASYNVSAQRNITGSGTNQFPLWSRDDKTIFYSGTDLKNFELWSIAPTGGSPKQLTNDASAPSSGNVSSTQPTG